MLAGYERFNQSDRLLHVRQSPHYYDYANPRQLPGRLTGLPPIQPRYVALFGVVRGDDGELSDEAWLNTDYLKDKNVPTSRLLEPIDDALRVLKSFRGYAERNFGDFRDEMFGACATAGYPVLSAVRIGKESDDTLSMHYCYPKPLGEVAFHAREKRLLDLGSNQDPYQPRYEGTVLPISIINPDEYSLALAGMIMTSLFLPEEIGGEIQPIGSC